MSIRPAALRRSWLFLPGAEREVLLSAATSAADVLIQELEDFTPPQLRPQAHAIAGEVHSAWKAAGRIAAVRVNPLDDGGLVDLEKIMPAHPDIVALPKVSDADQIRALDKEITRLEKMLGITSGSTEILPNIEYARGLVNTIDIAESSPRVKACLLAAEDLATDLGAERGQDGTELLYCRQRFIVECRAANVVPVDCPYTWQSGEQYLVDETAYARRLGYTAKSCVHIPHAALINEILSPGPDQIEAAQHIVAAFDAAREQGKDRIEVQGSFVEMPTYLGAKRLLTRAEQLGKYARQAEYARHAKYD
ncbi:MAG: CoA ester lyase [Rhizobiales bacterium]|nr:CoA ester lyase [Hyphomicrobiales bacterium]